MDALNTIERGLINKMIGLFKGFSTSSSPLGNRLLYKGYLSGYQYHQGKKLEHLFKPGIQVNLKLEPDNPFDDDAVAVYYSNARIGFIPSGWNDAVANLLKQGQAVKAEVTRFDPNLEPWERLQVEVVYEPSSHSYTSQKLNH